MEILKSKKARAAAAGILTILLGDLVGLDAEQVKMIVGLIMTYVFGQGIADHGKEKAKIEVAAIK